MSLANLVMERLRDYVEAVRTATGTLPEVTIVLDSAVYDRLQAEFGNAELASDRFFTGPGDSPKSIVIKRRKPSRDRRITDDKP